MPLLFKPIDALYFLSLRYGACPRRTFCLPRSIHDDMFMITISDYDISIRGPCTIFRIWWLKIAVRLNKYSHLEAVPFISSKNRFLINSGSSTVSRAFTYFFISWETLKCREGYLHQIWALQSMFLYHLDPSPCVFGYSIKRSHFALNHKHLDSFDYTTLNLVEFRLQKFVRTNSSKKIKAIYHTTYKWTLFTSTIFWW